MSWMSILGKKRKHPEERKNNNLLKTKRILTAECQLKGLSFYICLPARGGSPPLHPRQLRHCLHIA